jgi:dienelactone hydrolase
MRAIIAVAVSHEISSAVRSTGADSLKYFSPVAVSLVGLCLSSATWQPAIGSTEAPPTPAAIYSASDLPKLAEGVDPGITGAVHVAVWAPPRDRWQMSADNGTLSLKLKREPGDPEPQWQSLGTMNLVSGNSLKITIANDPPIDTKAEPAKAKKGAAPTKKPALPVPAFLALTQKPLERSSSALDFIRGRADTIAPTHDLRRNRIRTNWEGASFQAPRSEAEWRDRANHLRDHMRIALGLWPMFPKTPLNPKFTGKLERDQYTIERVVLETLPGFTLSGNLYRPATSQGRLPAILCPHGHWEDGRMNPEVQERCIRWAKLGCVVFMYDMVGYNDSKPFTHAFLNDRLRRWGLSLVTLQTWNSIRALDWLSTLPDVDPARIGCTGESGGGTQTFLLTALDDRIKVSAPVVMVSDSFQGGCVCENAAGLRHGTDNVEFAALCAPRPLIMVGATGDWTAKTMSRAYPAIRGVYSLVGSPDRVTAQVFDFPHNYNKTTRNAVYAFMGRWLLGIEDSQKTQEGEQKTEKAEDLATFGASRPAPANRKTPEQLESDLIAIQEKSLEELAPAAASPARWEAGRRLLMTALRDRVGLVIPSPADLTHHEVRRVRREGFTLVHSEIGRAEAGDSVAVVRISPTHSTGRITVIADPRGKRALTTAGGEPVALVKELLALGQSVVGFDPLFTGESFDPNSPSTRRPETAHFETYNPVVAADQLQDLATVVSWAKAQPDVLAVSLVGQDLGGPQVLLARPLLEGLSRTYVDLKTLPDPKASGTFPAQLDLPGMFQCGGWTIAAALAAPAPLWIEGAGPAFDPKPARGAYAIAGSEHTLRFDATNPNAEKLAHWIDGGE